MNRLNFVLIGITSVLLFSGASYAQDPDNRLFGLSSNQPAALYSINPATGSAVEVVELNGSSSIVGLSFIDGTPFGSDVGDFPGAQAEFNVGSISPEGVITFVSDQGGSTDWHGLASDDCDGRVLYVIDNNFSPEYPLRELSPDGTITTIGNTGVDAEGMAFDDTNGILYAIDDSADLYTISIQDGTSDLIGPTELPDVSFGLAYDEINGVLFAVAGEVGELYTLNVNSGEATFIGLLGVGIEIDGLAWRDDCEPIISQIPTLSEWGLIAMAALIGIAGLIFHRRRAVQA